MGERITVVGAGFAGLTALRTLRGHAPDAELTLVAPEAALHYLPGTIWIPAGLRSRADLVVPLDGFLRRERIAFHRARATGLSADARPLHTDAGDVANDGLLLATGARFIRKLPGIEHAIIPCEGVDAGEAIRDRLAALDGGTLCFGFGSNPNEPIAMRGGPVFEFVFGIDTLLRKQRRRDRFRLVFFSPSARLAVVGDVLFAGSIGRTDFPRGSHADLVQSIRGKLWPLGNDVSFIPGHGPMSTFGEERDSNPCVGAYG